MDGSFSEVAFLAVGCLDDPAPITPAEALEAIEAEEAAGRVDLAFLVGAGMARCVKSGLSDPVPDIDIDEGDTAPMLVIAKTHDPLTPYAGALDFAAAVRPGRLVTVVDDGHTAVTKGNTCVDAIAAAYLATGALPDEGTVCVPDAQIGFGFALGPNGSPLVSAVVEGSPADGVLQVGDEILSVDGSDAFIRPKPEKGVPIELVVIRDGEPLTVTVTPADSIFWLPDEES